MEDIAIIGLSVRFPGDASSPEKLWKVLERGESQWSEFPKDRLNIDGYYHPSGDRLGSISFRGGHFLKEKVAAFDAPFFNIGADEAAAIDPQQRFLLETSYEALENAGMKKEDVEGTDAAVYVGSFVKDYEQICLRDPDWAPQYAATGNGIAIMANRISYAFNFHGPSITVDTGCSGSLVTVHMAAQSLRSRETSLAIAAGAGLILTPNTMMPMTALNFLSPDGKCFTFDERADGYGRGEGVGVVVMTRISDAIRGNYPIRAVIRGTRLNQDGRTTGITLPSKEAQVANIMALYESTGLDFQDTGYVECHGTGTQAGDWRELKAISETIASTRSEDSPVIVGSVKPNIGHLEGAAGIAGLIKAVMAVERGQIPPNINYETPNPDIDFTKWKVKVPMETMEWPLPGVRRASINCFGFGGTNAHVILDDAQSYRASRDLAEDYMLIDRASDPDTDDMVSEEPRPNIFCFSSCEKLGVTRVIQSQLPYVQQDQGQDDAAFLRNYSYTLCDRRSTMEWKGFVVASSKSDLQTQMKTFQPGKIIRSSAAKTPRLCFVFPGQGAQWARMGLDLIIYPVFLKSLKAASEYMQTELRSSFNLWEELNRPSEQSRISDPEIAQPATTALQVALVDLLASMDICPQQVIGHSSGEIAAAYASGALTKQQAWEVAYHRGQCTTLLNSKTPPVQGGMIAIALSPIVAEHYLDKTAHDCQIACMNSPDSVTLSGDRAVIEAIAKDLKERKILHKVLAVSTAYHSRHMQLVEADYKEALQHLRPGRQAKATMFSSVTGEPVDPSLLDGKYWAKNMTDTVIYWFAVLRMMNSIVDVPDVIIELGPRTTLRRPTIDILDDVQRSSKPVLFSILEKQSTGPESFLNLLGNLWLRGQSLQICNLYPFEPRGPDIKCLTDLPSYPWNHSKSYWFESHLGVANRFRAFPRQDLIGAPTADSIPFEPRWRGFLRLSENPWIQDHQVQKTIVYPAAGMVTMVLEAAKQMATGQENLKGYELVDVRIIKAMIVPQTAHGLEVALNIKRETGDQGDDVAGSWSFAIYSKLLDSPWEQHATGCLRMRSPGDDLDSDESTPDQYDTFMEQEDLEAVVPHQLYEKLDTVGMNYGPLFRNIVELRKNANSCGSMVQIPNTRSKMPAKFEYPHLIHPATLDSMIQTLFAIDSVPMVPTFIESIFVSSNLENDKGTHFKGVSTAQRLGVGNAKADITMSLDGISCLQVVIKGLHLTALQETPLATESFLPNHHNLCTEIIWKEDATFAQAQTLGERLELLGHKHPALEILQIGGSISGTLDILESVAAESMPVPTLARYSIVDSTSATSQSLQRILGGTRVQPYVEYTSLDAIASDQKYHMIIVSTLPDIDPMQYQRFAKSGGWVVGTPAGSQQNLLLDHNAVMTRIPGKYMTAAPVELVFLHHDGHEQLARSLIEGLSHCQGEGDYDYKVSSMPLGKAMENRAALAHKVVVPLFDLHAQTDLIGFVQVWDERELEFFQHVHADAKGIIWITCGANKDPQAPLVAPIIGLARTLMSEDPRKLFVTLDLGMEISLSDGSIAAMLLTIFLMTFCEIGDDQHMEPKETEFSEADGKLYIPRLVPIQSLNQIIENGATDEIVPSLVEPVKGVKVEMVKAGTSRDSVKLFEYEVQAPQSHEVQIQFEQAELNHRDVEIALGQSTSSELGRDLRGTITNTGSNVSRHHKIGDKVVALVPNGSLKTLVNVDARFVLADLAGFTASSSLTAFYALCHVGKLEMPGRSMSLSTPKNSSALISGGVGYCLPAFSLCEKLNVKAFFAIANKDSPRNKEALRRIGVDSERILEAGSVELSDILKQRNNGKGMDVVLHASPSSIELTAACVKPGGAIVHVQHQTTGRGTTPVKLPTNSTYVKFDLENLLSEAPDFVADLLLDTYQAIASCGDIVCEGKRTFEMADTPDSLTQLRESPSLDSVTITLRSEPTSGSNDQSRVKGRTLKETIDPKSTYLLSGGLGGLGRSIATLLAENGARFLVFLSRRGAETPVRQEFVAHLRRRGVRVRVYPMDISSDKGMVDLFTSRISWEMPPAKGIFQCVAVIRDAMFDKMTLDDWEDALMPKVPGSKNLVDAAYAANYDPFFVFLASAAGVVGNRGQANYAAGNCFQDALARNLRLKGKNAVAIDLGPILGAGMLADDENLLNKLLANGFYGISHDHFLQVIKHAITMETLPGVPMPPQVTLGIGTGGLIRQNKPADPYWSRTAMYSYLNLVDMPPTNLEEGPSATSNTNIKSLLRQDLDVSVAKEVVCTGLMQTLAKAMNMLFEEMDPRKQPSAYGVDSLVAVGVRNWVYTNCNVQVSVFEILSEKTIQQLSAVIVERCGFGACHHGGL
ncbi:uncharacterized protein F5Z01DRAFT_622595 [Emericellopsis atlantica]|uniref:Polyketide synthase n=1 Tax=Emericellopsis atlantica TaxID=2614577 RepID=A0A9P7ZM22_9HYPO|nr:uncharacterized protein F5Z01DRAFT_622595 [Emericellopsis atlantica]KAG9254197.1 hypothetical protein F5Z01DRAFT_622595 [Emericellopsis atlantica]